MSKPQSDSSRKASITEVPVTPGVSITGHSAYEEPEPTQPLATPGIVQTPKAIDDSTTDQPPHWNANSYFPQPPETDGSHGRPHSPTKVAAGAKSGAELLRRLSLVETPRPETPIDTDPRELHPNLHLSGNVISATFCLPHTVGLKSRGQWELTPRRGTSALFDSFSYLSSGKTPWRHTLVGWTGEIEPVQETVASLAPQVAYNSSLAKSGPSSLSKASAPIPVDANAKPQANPAVDGIKLTKADRERLEQRLYRDPCGHIIPVWLPDEQEDPDGDALFKDQVRWRNYAEHELYTLFHYKQHGPTDGRAERKWWLDYYNMNQKFAEKILQIYKPGDIVWIHDYHLFLVPGMLRQRIPSMYIGFFLHIPFPSSEYMRCLTRRKDLLTGVLGANMIGFQSYSYSRHFVSCCTRILGFESSSAGVNAYGAHVAVDVFPIGIDAAMVSRIAYEDPQVKEKIDAIREMYYGKKIIVGRDRLDTVRGVAQKLMAFEMFLERYPEWQEKVVLIQVTSPTSIKEERDDADKKISKRISELVSRINGRFGSISFSPVQHYPQYISRDEYFALLRVADVGLITSVRDGMNTTSLEYVVCQNGNYGPVILSEFSGTAGSLSSAMHINPWDLGGVAAAINRALAMPSDEKVIQHKKLYRHVTTHTVQAWANLYLKRLLTNLSSFNQSLSTPALDKAKLLAQYRLAKHRLFMFDYDGTLTPIVRDPQAAIPSDRVIRTLKTLASDPRNSVWIISGRDQVFLDEWMGHIPELGLSAEHGCFIRHPRSDKWENLAAKTNMDWQKEVIDIFQHYMERTQGSFIERKRVALTWHYRRADPEYGAFQARECRKHLENSVAKKWDVEVMAGKANIEVRPRFVNKGEIVKKLVNEFKTEEGMSPEFIYCLGDDFTDEDMFRALRNSNLPDDHVFACTVGASSKQTLANWHLLEPSDVIASIALLNGHADASDLGAVALVQGAAEPRL
ncbi:MAG: threalose-6-phosphate phosphatase [Cirrosporium novae-zelandiae]|nr:MAG: threalose-6-phosphate phosphatase [Cirrosporium novae-zelandiae]